MCLVVILSRLRTQLKFSHWDAAMPSLPLRQCTASSDPERKTNAFPGFPLHLAEYRFFCSRVLQSFWRRSWPPTPSTMVTIFLSPEQKHVRSLSSILYRCIITLNVCDQLTSGNITLMPLEQRWILSFLLWLFFLVRCEGFRVCRSVWFTG
jgi:hypothetical protein